MPVITPQRLQLQCLQSTEGSVKKRVSDAIGEAFGPGGPGLLLIDGLKESFAHERLQLFAAARALAALEPEKLKALEFPDVQYSIGWSRGRESFKGVVDSNKGSFYANPIFDDPSQGDRDLAAKYPHYMHSNYWPSDPSCSQVEQYFKSLGSYINEIGILLAKHCDDYVKGLLDDESCFQSIEQTVRSSRSAKGRLLHYFPLKASPQIENDDNETMWCGYHNDHGSLTGLISGAYFASDKEAELSNIPDTSAGLYVARGEGNVSEKVHFPADCLAFQIGESAQIASGGILRATPHAVRAMTVRSNVSRITMAVFLQPNPWDALRPPSSTWQSGKMLTTNKLVPPLTGRYCPGDRFSEFNERTIQSYYS